MSPRSVSRALRSVSALLIVAIALTLAACGSSSKSSGKKTSPLANDPQLSLAYAAFRTYIVGPAVRGDFKPGAPGRSAAIKQSQAAAAVSITALNGSKARATTDKSLKAIAGVINATATAFGGIPVVLQRKGDINISTLSGPLSTLASLATVARTNGIDITHGAVTPAELQTTP